MLKCSVQLLDQGQAGDNVGLLLRGVEKKDIQRGHVIAKPGSITPHTKGEAQIYVLTKDEGGRHTPFFKGYRPQFFFGTADVTGICELPEGVEMVMPGDNLKIVVDLQKKIAMEEGQRFAIREGGRTIGAGQITKVPSIIDKDFFETRAHPGLVGLKFVYFKGE